MNKINNADVNEKFESYPKHIRTKMLFLRKLILETASETEDAGNMEESLKWGEPAYRMTGGTTVRMDWKQKNPDQYAMYFHCKTSLVESFRELYPDRFKFEGNRAILFDEKEEIPVKELKHCISMALTYHRK